MLVHTWPLIGDFLVAFLSALLMAATFLPGSAADEMVHETAPFLLKEPCHPLETNPFGWSTTSALWQVQEKLWFIDYLAFLIIRVRDDLLQLSAS